MKQHYFIAINAPLYLETPAALFEAHYQLRKHYKVLPLADDYHITMLYVGEIPQEKMTEIKTLLNQIAEKHEKFRLTVDGLNYFGADDGPRVVYLQVRESARLAELQREIHEKVCQFLERPLPNRFVPHITIAKKRKTNEPLQLEKTSIAPIGFPVDVFALYAIHPKETPRYKAEATFALQKAEDE